MARAEIRARATLDNKQFKTGVAQMNQGVSRFANGQIKQMAGLIGGAFAVGAVINFTKEMFSAADALDNASKQMNIGVEELQALRRETELTAGSADKMDSTLRKLTKSMANAVAGESEQVDGFKDLGISMQEVQTLSVDQLFEKIAVKVSGASLASKEASGASKILGRNYVELNTVMDTLATTGLENLKNQMLETNQIMSEGSVAAADAMEESFNRSIRGMTNTMREWAMNAIGRIQDVAAWAGARSAGATMDEAAIIVGNQQVERRGIPSTAADRKAQSSKLASAMVDPAKTAKAPAIQAADQIAKIGGILGGQTSAREANQIAKQSLDLQRMTKDAVVKSAMAAEETAKNTAPIREG